MLNMKLRGKIMLVLLLVAVFPLVVSLVFLSNFTRDQIRSSMLQFTQKSSNFVERTTANSKQELSNYLNLLSSSSDIVNALYYATLTQDIDQLNDLVQDVHQRYDMDILEILGPDGSSILRINAEDLELPSEAETDHPLLAATRDSGEPQSSLTSYLGKLTILSATPVRLQENVVGFMVGAYLLDDSFAGHIKEMGGVEVAFVGSQGVVGASHPDFKGQDITADTAEILLGDKPYLPISRNLADTSFNLVIAQDMDDYLAAQQSLRNLMFALVVAVIAIVLGASLLFSKTLTRPLLEIVNNLKDISQGEADLTKSLEIKTADEVGELAGNFNWDIVNSSGADISPGVYIYYVQDSEGKQVDSGKVVVVR